MCVSKDIDNVLPALGSTIKISVETNFEISFDWGVKLAFVHGHFHLKEGSNEILKLV